MNVLVIAAHPDDEILGVGGTILKHKAKGDSVSVCIVTKAYPPEWGADYINEKVKEAKKVDKLLGIDKRIYCGFPTVKLNTIPTGEFNKKIYGVVEEAKPDIIYTHFKHDVNLDHKIVFNAVMVAARPVKRKIEVRCFETISSTEWNYEAFIPNLYIDITEFIDKKIEAFKQYKSEVKKYPHPRSPEGVRTGANRRGMEICTEYAEAFMIIRRFE